MSFTPSSRCPCTESGWPWPRSSPSGDRPTAGPARGSWFPSTGRPSAASDAAAEALRTGRSDVRSLADGVRAFVEVLEPPVRLLVCGAGHDAAPVVRAAAALGWNAVVADDRAAFLTPDRYPEAAGFVLVDQPRDISVEPTADERTYAVVMTHNFLRDKSYLE